MSGGSGLAGPPGDRSLREMFDDLAPVYDRSNRITSGTLDRYWRAQAVSALDLGAGDRILDLGTGTGPVAYRAAGDLPDLPPGDGGGGKRTEAPPVVGVDVARGMLQEARRKRPDESGDVGFVQASALAVPHEDATFEAVVSAFALRNVADREAFAEAAFRVLVPGGRLALLELYDPADGLLAPLYRLYFHRVLPGLGRLVTGDAGAYEYLSESVREMVAPGRVTEVLAHAGFVDVETRSWFGGLVTQHVARKPAEAGLGTPG